MGSFSSRVIRLCDGRNLRVESVIPEDAEDLIVFLQKISEETSHTLQFPGREYSLYALQQRIGRTLQSRTDLLLCAKDGNQLVSHLDFQVQNERHPWVKHVGRFGIAVLAAYQRQGLARALIFAMEEWAHRCGISRIEAVCRTDNEPGLKTARTLDYALEGLRHNSLLIDGVFKDEYYFAKILPET